MKLTAGLGRLQDYPALVQAGADEVYCGCVPYDWLRRYGSFFALNRREVLYYSVQLGSMEEMRILAHMQAELGVPVAITFNSLYYLPDQYPAVLELMHELIELGFSRFIVADPALILHIRQVGLHCQLHLSGEMGEVNTPALRFFRQWDISRVILHRKVSLPEIKSLIQSFPDCEYEAFLLNERCHYTGAYCNSLHCDELPHLCRLSYRLLPRKSASPFGLPKSVESTPCYEGLGESGCGLCAIKALHDAGVSCLKIVGRGNHLDCTVRDIRAVKKALLLAEQSEDQATYRLTMKKALFPEGCSGECYYGIENT